MGKTSAAALAAMLFTAGAAGAQELGGAPGFGVLEYHGAAQSLPARAGGAASLAALGCSGYSTLQPTVVISVSEPAPLFIAAGSDQDLTLAVRGPDGAIVCADDEAGELNPGAAFPRAQAGRYEVWVGTFGGAQGYPPITVNAAPDRFDTSNPYIVTPNPELAGEQALRLSGRFDNDPRTLDVTAGGEAVLSMLDGRCAGRSGPAPAAVLTYGGGDLPLHLLLESEADATLAVVAPSGAVFCADDTIDSHAGVRLEDPAPGRYAIFAGLFDGSGGPAPATLTVSEIGFGGVDRRLDVAGEPVFGQHDLPAGFTPDPAAFAVTAGGPVNLSLPRGDARDGCAGNTTRTPSLRLNYDGRGPLFISMQSAQDTTLAVNGPDGRWACDDDSLGDFNPLVRFDAAMPGVYDVYAGVFFADEPAPATIYVSEVGPGADPSSRIMDAALEAAHSASLQPGFAPEAARFAVMAGGEAEPGDVGGVYCPGYYAGAPSLRLDWAGGPVAVSTDGDADTTLAVRLPDGQWLCDDDGGEDFLSRLTLPGAPGEYAVWVGTFGGAVAEVTLALQEPPS